MLRILKPGILSTIQDLGRLSTRAYGVPVSGAMDTVAHRLANYALGNHANTPSLEIGGGYFAAWAQEASRVAHFGSGAALLVDQKRVPSGKPFLVPAGALLEVCPDGLGNYSYLAVFGGWAVPEVLNSRSTCLIAGFGGFAGRALQKGDVLKANTQGEAPTLSQTRKWGISTRIFSDLPGSPDFPGFQNLESLKDAPLSIRVLPGPEWHWWTLEQQAVFLQTMFTVGAQRDRMGIRLQSVDPKPGAGRLQEGLSMSAKHTMLSAGVCIGAIQLPPGGQAIVLCADAQTTGGYPRVAQIAAVDMSKMVQAPTGQKILFQMLGLEAAEALLFEREQKLTRLSIGCKLNANN